jgi:formate hydrogenlyase transcriptional activator
MAEVMTQTFGATLARKEQQSYAARYEMLFRVSQAISAYRDPRELFSVLAGQLRSVVLFDGIGVIQFDEAGDKVKWHVAEKCTEPGDVYSSQVGPEDELLLWVYQNQEPVWISSVENEQRFPATVERLKNYGIQSGCVLPLSTAHRRLGCLFVGSERRDSYGQEDVYFLSLFANQLAVAMDNALNFERSQRSQTELQREKDRLDLLLDLTNSITSNLELQDLLRTVSANARRVMQCDLTGVILFDPETKQLRLCARDFPEGRGFIPKEGVVSMESPIGAVFRAGKAWKGHARDIPNSLAHEEGLKTGCALPLVSRNRVLGVLTVGRRDEVPFTADDMAFLTQVANQIAIAVENALAYKQIADLKDKLSREKLYLEDEIRSEMNFEEIIGKSVVLKRLLKQVETVAPTESTVLIHGETGVGKELIARAIHNRSVRRANAFVKLNCAAIPTGLLESELFGHEKGAFTGAIAQRIGRFELANNGTVFLDEIGEIPLELQPKLLRVLQEREFERLGSSRTLRSDARLIAATNRDLEAMVSEQKFRSDLFYRLNVFPVRVAPLRERPEDIPLLVRHFASQFARRINKDVDTISSETMKGLVEYHWPGNVRELQNVIERAVITSEGAVLEVPLSDLKARPMATSLTTPNQTNHHAANSARQKLRTEGEEAERNHILSVLEQTNWVVAGPNGAALRLGMKRSTLQFRMRKLGLTRNSEHERTSVPSNLAEAI